MSKQVIIRTQFMTASNAKRNWYQSNYISDHKNLKPNMIAKKSSFKSSIDYSARKTETTIEKEGTKHSLVEYMDQSYKVTSGGHFTKDGILTNDEFKEEAILNPDKWKIKDDSIIWSTVVSFTNDFTNENNIQSKEDAADLVRNTIDQFFIENKIDPDSMEYLGQFHVDTPHHFHIHLRIHQKEAGTLNRKTGNMEFRTKGKMTKASYERWRGNIEEYATEKTIRKKLQYKHSSNLRDKLKTKTLGTFDSIKGREDVINLSRRIKKRIGVKGRFQYGAIKDKLITRPLVDKLVQTIIDSSKESKQQWKKINMRIDDQMDELRNGLNLKKESNRKFSKMIENKRKEKKEDVWKHLANQILKKVKNNNWDRELGTKEQKIPITPRMQYKKRNKAISNFTSKSFWNKLGNTEMQELKAISNDIVSMIENEKANNERKEEGLAM